MTGRRVSGHHERLHLRDSGEKQRDSGTRGSGEKRSPDAPAQEIQVRRSKADHPALGKRNDHFDFGRHLGWFRRNAQRHDGDKSDIGSPKAPPKGPDVAVPPAAPAEPKAVAVVGPSAQGAVVPRVDQYSPVGAPAGYDGTVNCGPAVMTMIAKAIDYQPKATEAELIGQFAKTAQTNELGTCGNGLIAVAEQMGMQCGAAEGANMGFVDDALAAGKYVIANGDYYALAPHEEPDLSSGHYVLIHGIDADGMYMVNDPADAKVDLVSRDALQGFILSQPVGGFVISAVLAELAAAAAG